MELLLGTKSLPPGFRFNPTDEELFMYHLKRKVLGKNFRHEVIAEVDVYRFAPWDLPSMASLKSRDLNWYFFCPRGRKYPNGGRANRATEYGYWKSTGNDRTMMYNSRPVGNIKTLVFHRGKPPKGERTDWVMHEYRLEDKELAEKGVPQDSFVICKIYEKSGLGPKNGEHYGSRFVEAEWDSDDDDNVQERGLDIVSTSRDHGCVGNSHDGSISALTTAAVTPNIASLVELPAAVATTTVAEVIHPDMSTAFVPTPFTPASVGAPSAPASVGTPFTPASVGTVNVTPASASSSFAFTSSVCSPSTAVANVVGEPDEDELGRMLAYFVEGDGRDIFNGLEDLDFPSGPYDLGLNDHLSMDDLK